MAVGGLGMMIPGTATDIAGFVLVVGIVLYQRFSALARRHGLNDLESAPRLPGSTFSHIPAGYKRYRPREKL